MCVYVLRSLYRGHIDYGCQVTIFLNLHCCHHHRRHHPHHHHQHHHHIPNHIHICVHVHGQFETDSSNTKSLYEELVFPSFTWSISQVY